MSAGGVVDLKAATAHVKPTVPMPQQPRSTPDRIPTVAEKLTEWECERDLRETEPAAVYVSTPITSGRRFIDWWRQEGVGLRPGSKEFVTGLRANVILPNMQRVARFLELLRWRHVGVIIDPTSCEVPGWSQEAYNEFWTRILERHVKRVLFLRGWEYSRGCVQEFETAQRLGLDCVDEQLSSLSRSDGLDLIESAIVDARAAGIDVVLISAVYERMRGAVPVITPERSARELHKDQVLDHLARTANVAQFVSFSPGLHLEQRYCRIRGYAPNHDFGTVEDAVRTILQNAPEGAVNIRSFDPRRPEGNPFLKRLTSADEVMGAVRRLADASLYTIVNEAIDESDGGVSGVAYRGVLEFAPDATPRCVDDVDVETATLPFEAGMILLQAVYGFEPDLRGRDGARVEFSIHPAPRGWRSDHTVLWQLEQRPASELKSVICWPHRFSRLLGDKAFGLVVGAALGLPVPRTLVFTRRLFPFSFGRSTGSRMVWTRTCPETKAPGLYPSALGWRDPMAVLDNPAILNPNLGVYANTPAGLAPPLASVLIQEAVQPAYSGTAVFIDRTDVRIEGVPGQGDGFMIGATGAETIPRDVERKVRELCDRAWEEFGPLQIEWVFDGGLVWVVQLNLQRQGSPRMAEDDEVEWEEFRFHRGDLERFRRAVLALRGSNKGIVVIGNVSPLSHAGEIAEQYSVPARFVRTHTT